MYWLVLEYWNKEDAMKTFSAYAETGIPVLLFESWHYPQEFYFVAAYANDKVHGKISRSRPTANESYLGLYRVLELLRHHLLVDAANFDTRNIDEIIDKVKRMQDTWY